MSDKNVGIIVTGNSGMVIILESKAVGRSVSKPEFQNLFVICDALSSPSDWNGVCGNNGGELNTTGTS